MTPEMKKVVESFQTLRLDNPDEDGVDTATRLQQHLVFLGKQHSFTEKDIAEAARVLGIPEDEIPDLMDELASWL